MGPRSNMMGALIRRWPGEDTDTQGEHHATVEVGWSDAAASRGMPKTAGSPPETTKRQRRTPPEGDHSSADLFISASTAVRQ